MKKKNLKKLKKLAKNPWLYVGIVAVIIVGLTLMPEAPGEYDEFATCLAESDATMYGTSWCSYCKKQKELFGNSFRFVDYVDCDKDKEACIIAGVGGYPTWQINGENYPGVQSFQKLSDLTGCQLN